MDTTAAALVDPYLQDVRDAHFDLGDKLGILVSAVVLSTSVNRMICPHINLACPFNMVCSFKWCFDRSLLTHPKQECGHSRLLQSGRE